MPLPTGTWKANVNGTESDFVVTAPNPNGVFSGTLFGAQLSGFWNEPSQEITFSLTERLAVVLFKGYLFRTPPNPTPGRDVLATLAGIFLVTPGENNTDLGFVVSNSRRNVFAWIAQLTEII